MSFLFQFFLRLEDTYHYEDGICLPRSTIYEHYVDFCQCELLQPVNAASFGKVCGIVDNEWAVHELSVSTEYTLGWDRLK